jgi:hypothetical protein
MNALKNWIDIPENKKTEIFNQAGIKKGLSATAIEKDWWVTLILKTVFSLSFSEHLLFKGGTSLSKGWNLIERFSEDIDLSINRKFFGFEQDISKTQIQKLRKASCKFIKNEMFGLLIKKFGDMGFHEIEFALRDLEESDKDPVIIEFYYKSITDEYPYLKPRVLLEIGSRSLREPFEKRIVRSLVSEVFESYEFSDRVVEILVVSPKRTFLEKILLLHEEFQKPTDKIRTDRLSRHLYDIEKIMDTRHGKAALSDSELFKNIVSHRKHFNAIRGIDYNNHRYEKLSFIPPDEVLGKWEKDYEKMRESMIYGESLSFEDLIKKLKNLQEQIRSIKLID